jgi:membrane protease YdiL (CAAX protease family)
MARDRIATVSPWVLILVCRSIEQVTGSRLGPWGWVPAIVVFWIGIAVFVKSLGGANAPARWFSRPSARSLWCVLSVGAGLLSLPGFLLHWRILMRLEVLFPWLVFALVNPLFEEAYWRGFLLDATRSWPPAVSVPYSATLFALSHPWIWGVQAAVLRDWRVIPVLTVLGFVWAMAYRCTGSLWCSVVGHASSNLLGMTVPLLMNLYSPMPSP